MTSALRREYDEVLETAADRLRDLNPEAKVVEAKSVAGELSAVAQSRGRPRS